MIDISHSLIDPKEPLEHQRDKLLKIADALMTRVEQDLNDRDAGYAHFQRAVMLEEQIRARTSDLEQTMDLLNQANAQLAEATRKAEQARANLSNALEAVQEGFALFDAEERLVMCNSRFARQTPEIQQKLTPGIRFGSFVDMVADSGLLELPPGVTKAEWRRERLEQHNKDFAVYNVRLTGDRWLQISEQRTDDGGSVVLHTDVTDIIRLERAERARLLADQARLIRATLDHISQGVCMFDPQGQLVGSNRRVSALLAVRAERLVPGMGIDRLLDLLKDRLIFTGDNSAETLGKWAGRSSGRTALSFEVQRGESMILDIFAEETPDGGFVISFTDVTGEREAIRAMVHANESLEARVAERTLDLEHALADAERANASKSRFVAAASHDLLQPLSAAKLFLSTLETGDPTPAARIETVQRARGALGSVETMLGSLLDISRLDAGLAAMEPGPVPLGIVLATLADEFEPLAEAKGLDLTIVPCSAEVKSDPVYLRRILQNLIANAVRYTRTGRVLVGARRRPGGIRVEVWDTGPGIPEGERSAIFNEFHRGDGAISSTDGVGLGLAIVERACRLLNHEVGLISETGRGSVFSVTFALSSENGTRSARPRRGSDTTEDAAPHAPLTGLIALVVHSDSTLRAALCQQLEAWQMEALDAGTTAEATALLNEIDILPDLLILGLHHGEGASRLDSIRRAAPGLAQLPTMVISADRTLETRHEMERRGVELAHAPVDPEKLARRLQALAAPAITLTG